MTDTYSSQPTPPVPGLLSDQSVSPTSQGLMSLGAGLIKAGGPTPYRGGNFSAVGDAILGGLDAYHKSTTQALQNAYLKGQISKEQLGTFSQALQVRNQQGGLGLPEPKWVTDLLGPMPAGTTTQATASPAAPSPATGAPPTGAAPTGALPAVQGLLSANPGGPQSGNGPVVASTGGGSILPGGAQIMGGTPPPSAGLLSPQGPVPTPGAQMAFNDRIPPNGGMPAGLLTPTPPMPTPRPQSVPQGPQLRLASVLGAPPVSSGAPVPAAPLPATPAPATPQGAPGANPAFANLTQQQRMLLAAGGPNAALLMKSLEPTPEMLNARASGFNSPLEYETAKESGKTGAAADAKLSDTIYKGLTGQASIAAQQKQNIAVLRQIADSPNFTPGAGSDLALSAQRLAAQFGINPAGAAPRELFNQISARVLADQFSGLKSMASETGEQGGRIFKPMLDLEEKANITPNDSLAGIKSKLDMLDKSGDLMMKWGNMADDHKLAHGQLDPTFYKQLRSEIAGARIGPVLPPPDKPTHFANGGNGGRLGLVNGEWVPVDKNGAVLPVVGASR